VTRKRTPTIIEVAERAGVSKSLVSLALRGAPNVSESSRAAILRAAAELGYRPNAVARSLVSRRSFVLGVMVSDLSNPFFTQVVEGIEEAALEADYRALINTGRRQSARESEALDTLLELRTDGLILAGTVISDAEVEAAGRAVPTVLATRTIRSAIVDNVTNDDRVGAVMAVEHLVNYGHRRIAHVTGGRGAGARRRRLGYSDAMKAHGLGSEIMLEEGAYTEAGGSEGAARLLARRPRPTAIFAPNDLAALGALHAIESAGLRVPEDVSLVGYDDIALAGYKHIDLTTIHQPQREMGRKAVELLLERIDGSRTRARRIVIKPELVVRATTGPVRRHNRSS
jgi:DNA-binding LacI/PurR family transcriptional regulator